jgi:predicted phosphohydrolase
MRFAWASDIHLDFIDREEDVGRVEDEFAARLALEDFDGVFITGDISVSHSLQRHLQIIERVVKKPIYFVCGNHDFYGNSVASTRDNVAASCASSKYLKYLTDSNEVISLTKDVAIVGHDGWYDAMYGDPFEKRIVMSDWLKITDFFIGVGPLNRGGIDIGTVISIARGLAFEAVEYVSAIVAKAAQTYKTVVILTHVPPFVDPSSEKGSLPWYSSKLMGDAIRTVGAEFPNVKFSVLCGHTHEKMSMQISRNIVCHSSDADYGSPKFQLVEVK